MIPPIPERDLEGIWYAGIYYKKTKETLYIGCVTRCFLTEEDGPIDSVKMDCLKPTAAPSMILEEQPQHIGKDIGVFKGYNAALQIRAGQRSITINLWALTAHIYHVMIVVTDGFSKKSFYYYYFYFAEILFNNLELVLLELLNIENSFLFCAQE